MTTYKDVNGIELEPGQLIAWAYSGSNIGQGKIISITEKVLTVEFAEWNGFKGQFQKKIQKIGLHSWTHWYAARNMPRERVRRIMVIG